MTAALRKNLGAVFIWVISRRVHAVFAPACIRRPTYSERLSRKMLPLNQEQMKEVQMAMMYDAFLDQMKKDLEAGLSAYPPAVGWGDDEF